MAEDRRHVTGRMLEKLIVQSYQNFGFRLALGKDTP
jgi:hypothetical protein